MADDDGPKSEKDAGRETGLIGTVKQQTAPLKTDEVNDERINKKND
ncbi:hypothetical protein OHAE_5129 [Ochrobactrum soli]|uniref:Uncharacterized protein n=1 Tax=Ochrobactrum soli TaxID=2448455 RepID=A0A2P9HEJ1_9HYPH|nr:hypothetical protein OHAE_5129 [[Ochrobactrum] soli]